MMISAESDRRTQCNNVPGAVYPADGHALDAADVPVGEGGGGAGAGTVGLSELAIQPPGLASKQGACRHAVSTCHIQGSCEIGSRCVGRQKLGEARASCSSRPAGLPLFPERRSVAA